MLYRDAFKTATRSLTQGKMRSFLTMLGIVIGIASVILLMSIGESAQKLIIGQVEGVGSNLMYVVPGAPSGDGFSSPASSQGIVITSLVQRDIDALYREPSVVGAAGEVRGQGEIVYATQNKTISFVGVTEDYFSVQNMDIGEGRAFSKGDIDSGNHVAILGPDLAEELFGPNVTPTNKNIRLKNISFRVIGILEKGGTGAFGVDQGNLVILPVSVVQKQMLGINYFNDVIVKGNADYELSFVKSRVTSVLRQNHGITESKKDDFDIRTQEDILEILGSITSVLTLFLAAIASISLVVGGIGIMNIMLVAVTERTREIGLRKAVGATDKDILQQFLIESMLLTLVGGLIGIALGAALVGITYFAISTFADIDWVFAFPIKAVLLALSVSTLSGLIFGIYPARKAGRKNPIDALRYE
ncbi:MAG: ABC transporter permease [Candidatus Pacebacteria bacterium]|nr:ABC transporter permease [Candidatus Paceibacterota bacterium]MBP9851720.1 ABC transporter permease [Candidatus Paceibacterota bacterium]